nr:hypothetical protein [Halomonas sp.]
MLKHELARFDQAQPLLVVTWGSDSMPGFQTVLTSGQSIRNGYASGRVRGRGDGAVSVAADA